MKRYVLEKKLGAGAMGEVWLATDTLLNRPVAIKYLKSTQDSRPKEMFLSEAQALASLTHPNITLIYDAVFDEQQSQFFLVMEYVKGLPLSSIIDKSSTPLPVNIIIDMIIGILQALQYAHNKDIVHRDIKPANVIVQKDDVKLTDFGVAGLISLLSESTEYIVGTPSYMPPEQIETGIVDGRADLYSLGIMMYEMISGGIRPFNDKNKVDLFNSHIKKPPPSLRKFVPDIPIALEHTVFKLLAKNPEDRYPDATTVIEALNAIQARQKLSQHYLHLDDTEAGQLIGRHNELKQMEAIWNETEKTGQPLLLVVQGDVGSGKSRMITEFLNRTVIDRGAVAVAGRCDESGVPYAPFAEILADLLNKKLTTYEPTNEQINQLIDQIPSLSRLLNIAQQTSKKDKPRLDSNITSGLWKTLSEKTSSAMTTVDSSSDQWRFFETVLTLLSKAGHIVIFLEDAVFLDEASIALSRFLLRHGRFPLLLLAACRENVDKIFWFNSFIAEKIVITLPPLSTIQIKDYLTNILGGAVSDEATTLIEERSHGNPLNIQEVARNLVDLEELCQDEDGIWNYIKPKKEQLSDTFLPGAVLGVFTRRLKKLTKESYEALVVAPLIEAGTEFNFDLWLSLLGGEEKRELAHTAVQEAINLRLLRQVGENRYAFRPSDVANSLISSLTGTRKRDLHTKIAMILRKEHADPILVAYHYEQAGFTDKAVIYLKVAGANAISTNALNTAIAYYKRVVSLTESCSDYNSLGYLYRQRGNWSESIQAFRHGLELAKQEDDIDIQTQILNGLSYTLWLSDNYTEAYKVASSVLDLVGTDNIEYAIAQYHLGMISWRLGQLEEAEIWSLRSVDNLLKTDSKINLAEAHYRLGLIYSSQGNFTNAQTTFQGALTLREKLKDYIGQGHCLNGLGRLAVEQGDFEQALSFFEQAKQIFEEKNNNKGLVSVYANHSLMMIYQNFYTEALSLLNEALTLAVKVGKCSSYDLSNLYLLTAQANLNLGNIDSAESAANTGLNLIKVSSSQKTVALSQVVMAQIYEAQNETINAEAMYKKAIDTFRETGHKPNLTRALFRYAHFLNNQDSQDAALVMKHEALEEAEQMGLYLPSLTE